MCSQVENATLDRTTLFGDAMTVVTVGPCGEENNYSYVIVDDTSGECAVVDPAQCADDVIALVDASSSDGVPWKLTQILTTHHHWDHAFSNQRMVDLYPGLEVVGGEEDEVEACTTRVKDGELWSLGQRVKITALNTRGHTDGHMCYLLSTDDTAHGKAVFTGSSVNLYTYCDACSYDTPATEYTL